jgi:hypothetical protein
MNAIAYLDKWDEKGIRRVKTILKRHHYDQYEFVCTDLEPGKGPESVLAVSKLLKRIEALKSSPEREATREADHQALATLAKRKLDDELWEMLRGLVNTVQNPSMEEEPSIDEGALDDHHQALLDLYGWFQEWSELARDEIPRRDYLIRLGLAQRRSRVQKITGDNADDETPIEDPTEEPPPS